MSAPLKSLPPGGVFAKLPQTRMGVNRYLVGLSVFKTDVGL